MGTARDRFAAVALDNPSAPYANDALTLGLIIAEEMQNPTGGPGPAAALRAVRVVGHRRRTRFAARGPRSATWRGPSCRSTSARRSRCSSARRFELAELERDAGRLDHALAQLDRIVTDQPDGRLAARSLALRGEILADDRLDTVAARREYERLLAQYPDYLFAGEIRQRLRDLP